MTLIDISPKASLSSFLESCEAHGFNAPMIERIALKTVAHLRGTRADRAQSVALQELELRWYKSLENGGCPDYGVYESDAYMGELWACWAVYSRNYLRAIRRSNSLGRGSVLSSIGNARRVIDLGCGFGWTTASLKQMFVSAEVIGTNLDGTRQTAMARSVGNHYGFEVVPDVACVNKAADLIFASEYFEHILEPVDHLNEVLDAVSPKAMLIANAFGTRAIGHFESYNVGGKTVSSKAASKAFNDTLRGRGYMRAKTKMWNNRPAYWKKVGV